MISKVIFAHFLAVHLKEEKLLFFFFFFSSYCVDAKVIKQKFPGPTSRDRLLLKCRQVNHDSVNGALRCCCAVIEFMTVGLSMSFLFYAPCMKFFLLIYFFFYFIFYNFLFYVTLHMNWNPHRSIISRFLFALYKNIISRKM